MQVSLFEDLIALMALQVEYIAMALNYLVFRKVVLEEHSINVASVNEVLFVFEIVAYVFDYFVPFVVL